MSIIYPDNTSMFVAVSQHNRFVVKADPDKVPPDSEMHVKTTGPDVEEKLPELPI